MATINNILEDALATLGVGEDEQGRSIRDRLDKEDFEVLFTSNSNGVSVYLLRLRGRLIGTVYQTEIGDSWTRSSPDAPQFEHGAWQDQSSSVVAAFAAVIGLWLSDMLRTS